MKFEAAVLHKVGEQMQIDEVELAGLQANDVLIRVEASGLCHTDLEVIEGSLPYPLPIILGHEAAGVVEDVGPGVTLVKPGDHVVASWNPNCGHCYYCDEGQPILCEPYSTHQPKGRLLDGGTRLKLGDRTVHHFSMVCSHAQYCVVPESGAVKVPDAIPFDRACLIGCGVMTGVGAVLRVAHTRPGDTVAVVGCGAVGLNVVQGAALAGAERILAIDVRDDKLDMARTFGATHCLKPDDGPAAAVRDMTGGRGADSVFEAAGIDRTLQLSLDLCRPGGHLIVLGKTDADKQIELRWGSMMGERRIVRSSYGGARPRIDFPLFAEYYLSGKLKLDELITTRLSLADINKGFDGMRRGEVVRAVVDMHH